MARNLKLLFLGIGLTVFGLCFPCGAAELDSEYCLACHGDASSVGEELAVKAEIFDTTAHGSLGCPTCHESVTENHPDDGLTPSKAVCQDCHQELAEDYARSEHAGNASCGDCHNPHLVRGPTQLSGHDMNQQCAACHPGEEMTAAHATWLPQADLHMEMLPCISCHTGSENYVINLFISKRQTEHGIPLRGLPFELASFEELQQMTPQQEIVSLIDTDGNKLISLAELRQFNGSARFADFSLKGMLTPDSVTHNLQIHDNRWDCTFCHASGPEAMQTSFVSIPQPDGTFSRLPVEKGAVLDLLNGTPDFYMLGATRNTTLDLIGLTIVAGGLIMPVGHGTLRFLTRKNRK